jgi:WD40 repeat protein
MALAARSPWGLVASTCDGCVIAWDRATGGILYSNRVSEFPVVPLPSRTPSPDGRHFAFLEAIRPADPNAVCLVWWNYAENRREFEADDLVMDWYPGSSGISPDGRWIAYTCHDDSYAIRDLKTGRVQAVLKKAHTWTLSAVAFSPDGQSLATGSMDATVQLWDTATGRRLGPLLRGSLAGIQKLHFSADGKTLVSVADGPSAQVWNVQTRQQMLSLMVHNPVWTHLYHGIFSEDDRFLMESVAEGRIRVTRLPTLAEIDAIEKPGSGSP